MRHKDDGEEEVNPVLRGFLAYQAGAFSFLAPSTSLRFNQEIRIPFAHHSDCGRRMQFSLLPYLHLS